MTGSEPSHGTAIWTDGECVETVTRLLDRLGSVVELVGVGGPRHPDVDQLARGLDCPRKDDFRQLLVELQPGSVLTTTLTGVSEADIEAARRSGVTLLTTEPISYPTGKAQDLQVVSAGKAGSPPKAATELDAAPHSRLASQTLPLTDTPVLEQPVLWLPGLERTRGWQGAAEPTEVIGGLSLISYACFGQQRECSLFSRLYDAWRFIIRLTDLPDTIDASLIGPLPDIPTDPRGLTGTITAHARLPGNRVAVVTLSDCAGDWNRQAQINGEGGHLRVSDFSYTLYDDSGKCLDSLNPPKKPLDYTSILADRWQQWTNGTGSPAEAEGWQQVDEREIQACCLTCLLSARTASPESPEKMLRLHQC